MVHTTGAILRLHHTSDYGWETLIVDDHWQISRDMPVNQRTLRIRMMKRIRQPTPNPRHNRAGPSINIPATDYSSSTLLHDKRAFNDTTVLKSSQEPSTIWKTRTVNRPPLC